MAENSAIEWTTHTFNPWSGCTKVSAGCANCYAEVNYSVKMRGVKWGTRGNRIVAAEAMWKKPEKWNRDAAKLMHDSAGTASRPRVFCASLADVFEDWQGPMRNAAGDVLFDAHDGKPGAFSSLTMQDVRNRLFKLIDATPNLDWLILTKRPENVERMMPAYFPGGYIAEAGRINQEGPRPNLWLGTSVENQQTADERIPHLLRTPAAIRFLSVEPLLGPVDLHARPEWFWASSGIQWVIVGGESGPGARPCKAEWIHDIVRQCKAAGVPVFVKQLGGVPDFVGFNGSFRWPLADKKGGDPAEWPAELRVREYESPPKID